MALPNLSGTANLIADPEIRFSPSGVAVCKLRLAFNGRKLNKETNQWEDADTFFVDGVLFKQAAENAAESLQRGLEVVVTGRLKTESWEDKNGGGKRSAPSLLVDSIGPSLGRATAKVVKAARSGAGGFNSGGGPVDDPWANTGAAQSEEAPF